MGVPMNGTTESALASAYKRWIANVPERHNKYMYINYLYMFMQIEFLITKVRVLLRGLVGHRDYRDFQRGSA